ncbi:hypothetical protein HYALB_00004684 [Hymenoscyphus albidus]|uniref:Thioesterase domain-containing protein n=1 Tax=Hymenoscyphus albidus TaxID=595503 RepID=A0A9N9LU75_9HELO|nr:hypothetical protein HYALB_00004684 [Hymenoscyphus albidus]
MPVAASNLRRVSANIVKHSKAAKTTSKIPIPLPPQHQLRQYSNPPKTYFQPGDPLNPESHTSNLPSLPTSPPKTYFQPLDPQNVQSIGPDAQIYNLPVPPEPKKKRSLQTPILALSFLITGYILGSLVNIAITGEMPEPGSDLDRKALALNHASLNKLPIFQALSHNPDWVPCDIKKQNYIQNTLGGARGVELRRTFHNKTTGEVVSIIRFGRATAGWPTVGHGGVTATMISEVAIICAEFHTPGATFRPVSQSVEYKSPVSTLGWYVIRARQVPSLKSADHGFGVSCTLEFVDGPVDKRPSMISSVRFVKR